MQVKLTFIFLSITLLAGLSVYFRKGVPAYLKILPAFIAITYGVEVAGWFLTSRGIGNLQLYNFFSVFELCFFLYTLRQIIKSPQVQRILFHTTWIYPLIAVINIAFIQRHNFHSVTYSFGCLVITGFAIYYFYELFQLPYFTNLSKEPAFWICSGLLFFYCCSFPVFGLINFMGNVPPVILKNLDSILTFLNILLYSLFTIAFLCRIRIPKSTL